MSADSSRSLWWCQKMQFFKWPLGDGSKSEPIFIVLYIKMPKSTAAKNMFAAWYKIQL